MALPATEQQTFSIGGVVSRTAQVLGKHFALFLGLGVLAVIPNIIFANAMSATHSAGAQLGASHGFFILVTSLLSVALAFLLQAALAYATVRVLSEQPLGFNDALMTAVRAFFPLLGASIIFGLALVIAFMLLVVPGLMLMTAWAVAVPALVVERVGVFDSFKRSRLLTKGHRWSIFGLLLVYYLAVIILQLAMRPIFGLSLGVTANLPIAYIVVNGFIQAVFAIVSATGIACLYFELRSAKEGIGPQQLASVFD